MSDPGEPRVVVLADLSALADAAAEHLLAALVAALAARGVAHLALSGGSTAPALYRRLASPGRRDLLDWKAVHLWWGDERYVPPDHPDSNAGLAEDTLLRTAALAGQADDGTAGSDVEAGLVSGVPVAAAHVHPWPVDLAIGRALGPAWAAEQYEATIRALLPNDRAGRPIFDLLLLGVGPDGHTLSVFPGSPALAPDAPLALAVPAPEGVAPHLARLTLGPSVVEAAREVLVMVAGSAKARVLREILAGPRDPARLPAQVARRAGATWLLDAAAAARLRA